MTFSQKSSTFALVLTKTQSQLYQLYEQLEDTSYKRLYIFSSKSIEFYLSDITSRIELAKAWVHVIAENRIGKFNSLRWLENIPVFNFNKNINEHELKT